MPDRRPAAVSPSSPVAPPPQFVGVVTACCGRYARGYRDGERTASGRCPQCGRRFRVSVPPAPGPPGTGVSARPKNR